MSDEAANPFEGGGGGPVAKFPNKGDSVEGKIVKVEYRTATKPDGSPKRFPDGNPMPVVVVTLDTGQGEDEYVRDFVSGRSVSEFRAAVWAVEGDNQSPKVGAFYKREYTSDGKKKAGQSPEKLYEITYESAGDGDDDRELV